MDSKNIARVGDQTEHGAPLGPGPGSATVFAGGRAVWRAGIDQHICPLTSAAGPDGTGVAQTMNTYVYVDGVPVTCQDDNIVEVPGLARGSLNRIVEGCNWICLNASISTTSMGIVLNNVANASGVNASDKCATPISKSSDAGVIAPYRLSIPKEAVFGPKKWANKSGNTECVEFLHQAAGTPPTVNWKAGAHIKDARPGSIPAGTSIATFNEHGKYPTDSKGRHAAIYLEHDEGGIHVLDQWNARGEVKESYIRFDRPNVSRSNNADTYYIIE